MTPVMTKSSFRINLEKHDTKDVNDQHVNGSLIVVWRDWDNVIKNPPKMVYVSSVNPNEIKGPHIHTKRDSYFVCIEGKVVFIINNGKEYVEITSSPEDPVMVHVPKNIPSAHINISNSPSRVLAVANIAWRTNDNEMINTTFDDYDWNKWNK